MRLIDADSLKQKFMSDAFREMVDDEATAYDVEKICEQLGKKAFDVNVKYTPIGNSYPISVVGLEKAIEIVRNGGKE